MVHALVQFHVEEFEQFWRQFQARDFHLRQAHGSLGAQVFQRSDDPNWIVVLFQWESRRQMERFFQQLHSIMPGNGIMTPSIVDQAPTPTGPTQGITFLQKTGELEA
jgi:quinol monooxygenase YgiN